MLFLLQIAYYNIMPQEVFPCALLVSGGICRQCFLAPLGADFSHLADEAPLKT
jgi:hypothetical protein